MEHSPDDKKIIDLLSKLRDSNGTYPSDIYAARRQAYVKQVANIGLGLGIGTGIKNAAQSGNGAAGAATTVTSKILEITLVAAIALEAGAVAYLYRDKIAELIKTYTGASDSQDAVVVSPTDEESPSGSELVEATEAPTIIVTTPSGTVTVTSGTPSPEVAGGNNIDGGNGSSTTNINNATPDPGGNNGNQFGLTPKPERTKDSNSNNKDNINDNNSGENDKEKDKTK
jgi:hypothetical protein